VGIVAALAAEARTLGRAVPPHEQFALLPDGSLLAVSGMGFEAAERDARALIDAGCNALVSWGLAGALDPRVTPGTVVVPELLMIAMKPTPSIATFSSVVTSAKAVPHARRIPGPTMKRVMGFLCLMGAP